MADLAYVLPTLAETAADLRSLATQFEGSGGAADRGAQAIGHRKVVEALDHFVDNWRTKRESLVDSLNAVADMSKACHDGFRQTDEKLSQAAVTAYTSGGGRGARPGPGP